MSNKEHVVTPAEVNALRRQFDEALNHILLDRVKYEATKAFLQDEVINPSKGERVRDLAEECRVKTMGYYAARGINNPILKPMFDGKVVSNREFERRRTANQDLFFRHATKAVSYTAFMVANGQAEHWTITNEVEREKIVWEDTEEGYWFWADVAPSCPGLAKTWNDLSGSIRLLSLEEYVIVFWTVKSLTGLAIDIPTFCWLRTRYKTAKGLGALLAYESDGRVYVVRYFPGDLSVPGGNFGGRSSEVVRRRLIPESLLLLSP